MYKITGIKYDDASNKVEGYMVTDGNKSELIHKDTVYWLIKAGLIDNAQAELNDETPVVIVDESIVPRILSEEFQVKTEKVYEAIRKLSHNCFFNLNVEKCNVKIMGLVYTYRIKDINIASSLSNDEIRIPIKNMVDICGYEVWNTGTSLIYYETHNVNTGEKELTFMSPGEHLVLSPYELKLLLAQHNVKCANAYLTINKDGDKGEFTLEDDIVINLTHEITREVSFNTYPKSVLERIINTSELKEQFSYIEDNVV